ncbi:MAG: zf-HC2 domain-containing protein [Pyrinomonadaceae bacterium MAG19_C2-C3]|nr:zf-HC2 domain-containing protein [Pyrinomonadaceae bacterium MAG19_C2-C3]
MNTTGTQICPHAEAVAAYLDGEMEWRAGVEFESHFATCDSCRRSLAAQRQVLCSLHATFGAECAMPLPKDFARIVTAHAQNDMGGVRRRPTSFNRQTIQPTIRRNAVRISGIVMLIGVAAWAASGVILDSQAWRAASIVGEMIGRTVRDAAVCFAFVLRGFDELALRGVSPRFAVLGWMLFGIATALLWLFVRSYRVPRDGVSRFLNHTSSPTDGDVPLFD